MSKKVITMDITSGKKKVEEISYDDLNNKPTIPTTASDLGYNNQNTNLSAANTQEAIDKLFQYAYNGKNLIANVIGDPSVNTESFSQLANDLQNSKNNLASNLMNKGINATNSDSLKDLVQKVSTISSSGSGSNIIKNTKIYMRANTVHTETLNKAITLDKLSTSVIKYTPDQNNVVKYDCKFNDSDKSNFNYPSDIIFDGNMYLKDNLISVNSTDLFGTEEIYSSDLVDKSQFNSVENISIDNSLIPKISINGSNKPVVVTMLNDIDLTGIYELSQIVWNANVNNNGILKLALSIDQGTTYESYNGTNWQTINISDINDFKNNGMIPSIVNSLDSYLLELLRNKSNTIRIAYYIEKVNISDIANNDEMIININTPGSDKIAKQSDYNYTLESDFKTITYNVITPGLYTFIYTDSCL